MRLRLRAWHIPAAIILTYLVAYALIKSICYVDPWLLAAAGFGGVLALQ